MKKTITKIIPIWLFKSSELVDWPTGKPKARSVCYPPENVTFNDLFRNTTEKNIKGRTFAALEKQ